jgi:RecB family exonuclease
MSINTITTTVDTNLKPGDVWSPSQMRTATECPTRWVFKYVERLPDPRTSNLALGSAVHAPILRSMAQKIRTEIDLPVSEVLEHYNDDFAAEFDGVEFRDDEKPGEIRAMGAALVELYMTEAAPQVQPMAVETNISGQIGGVDVIGTIDLIATDGTIIDLKTAAKSPSGGGETLDSNQRLQLATYALTSSVTNGLIQIQTLVKTKTPKIVFSPKQAVTPADVQFAETMYPLVQRQMQAGLGMPNRNSMLCSRKNCPFWRACEKRFGGEVKD